MKSTITTRTQRVTTEQVNSAVVLYTYTPNIPDLLAGCLDTGVVGLPLNIQRASIYIFAFSSAMIIFS
jgi:hypothetical protein